MGPFKYELNDKGLEVKVGNWVMRRLPYSDIAAVSIDYSLWNEKWINPLPLKFVSIRRKSGIFKNFIINPENSEYFMAQLRARLA